MQVSIGSTETMADSCCITELKETIEKMNAELIQSYTKISELNAKVRGQDAKIREQEEGLSAAQKEMSNLREDNAQLARDLKESEEKCRAVQERLELAEQKLALFSQKPDATAEECLAQVDETNDNALGINSLHDEIILQVFGYLMQNQLGQIASVCKRWNVLTKSPVLWKKVNVRFSPSHRCQTTVAESLINGLPSCLTSIILDFVKCDDWIKGLEFEKLCPRLQEKCPHLEELILIHSVLPISPPSVIDLCTEFLQDVKNLIFHYSEFHCDYSTGECFGISKIEILDLFNCCFHCSSYQLPKLPFSKMPHLKQLHLYGTDSDDSFFEDDASFLNQLHVLNLGFTYISAETFQPIQNHGHNLKELYLCLLDLQDHDLTFTYAVFPYLKTICLYDNHVTCEGVVSLLQSCPSLENVYVGEDVAESFAAHPFVVVNRCKSGIVKIVDPHKHCHMWT